MLWVEVCSQTTVSNISKGLCSVSFQFTFEFCFFFRPEKSKNKNQKTTIGLQKEHSIPETTRMRGREGFWSKWSRNVIPLIYILCFLLFPFSFRLPSSSFLSFFLLLFISFFFFVSFFVSFLVSFFVCFFACFLVSSFSFFLSFSRKVNLCVSRGNPFSRANPTNQTRNRMFLEKKKQRTRKKD